MSEFKVQRLDEGFPARAELCLQLAGAVGRLQEIVVCGCLDRGLSRVRDFLLGYFARVGEYVLVAAARTAAGYFGKRSGYRIRRWPHQLKDGLCATKYVTAL
jgi:hypothetical protein